MQQSNKIAYLTFDDGPQEPYTSQILDILTKYNAKATFFVCGKNIERNPDTLQRIVAEGHSVGNHTYSHDFLTVCVGGKKLIDEISKTEALIAHYQGNRGETLPLLYRSPWGITMPWVRRRLKNKYRIYHWDIHAYDWLQPEVSYIVERVCKRIFPGIIILLHDGNKTITGDRSHTVTATEHILKFLTANGYECRGL